MAKITCGFCGTTYEENSPGVDDLRVQRWLDEHIYPQTTRWGKIPPTCPVKRAEYLNGSNKTQD